MASSLLNPRAWLCALVTAALVATLAPAASSQPLFEHPSAEVTGPLPGEVPGDPAAADIAETYPFFSTWHNLDREGYVEEEFLVSGMARAFSTAGTLLGSDVPYTTRIIVRRPAHPAHFNGVALAEWQNVTAGYDLDALWGRQLMREGYAWVGISAQRVGVDHLRSWSPARYGQLDVTGGGAFVTDQLSYDIFAQAARALVEGGVLGSLEVDTLLAIGASQSAGRMSTYYNNILTQFSPVFDGYGFIVGSAPSREGVEPVFQVLSETDVFLPSPRPDTDQYRRWEVAGSAHSGWAGQEYRGPLSERDLGGAPEYDCNQPPFSRAPLHHVTLAAYGHLAAWASEGTSPPIAPRLEFSAPFVKARDDLGIAKGGIRLSQVEVPIALNSGSNSGESFCGLFGTHQPFDQETLRSLYRNHGGYVSAVVQVDTGNVRDGFLLRGDAQENRREAAQSSVGK